MEIRKQSRNHGKIINNGRKEYINHEKSNNIIITYMILKQLTKGIRIWQKMKQQYRNQHNIMNLF
jgi:hypothetical protein